MKILLLLFVTVLIFLVGCTELEQKPTVCTTEAKVCADGSVVTRTGPNCEFAQCPEQGTKCLPEQRGVTACHKMLKQVCGWNDPEKIQCVTYPCADTYDNDCLACANEDVAYYTEGKCPDIATVPE